MYKTAKRTPERGASRAGACILPKSERCSSTTLQHSPMVSFLMLISRDTASKRPSKLLLAMSI